MSWGVKDANELYGVSRWGKNFFEVNAEGEVAVKLVDGEKTQSISLKKIVDELRERGRGFPLLLRFRDLLDSRIEELNESFNQAMKNSGYRGEYRGVYPVKVNQQQQVIEEIVDFGKRYHYGLEVGSKPELIAALAYLEDPEALLICNGYKDDEFIDLALSATRIGKRVIIVIEMPGELAAILKRAKALGVRPELGVRFRLSTLSEGHWAESGGDRSTFGLNAAQLIDAVDFLKSEDHLDCLKLFHYHQGSQLPNIAAIRKAANEAVRVYVSLVKEGAPMGYLDMGGGLAVDYDGSHSSSSSSCNYELKEYAVDMVEAVQGRCDDAGIDHPCIVTESGRAVVAYYSVLVFDILDVAQFEEHVRPDSPGEESHEMLHNLWKVGGDLREESLQECFNDACYYRDQMRELFNYGVISLRERGHAEKIYWYVITMIAQRARKLETIPEELQNLDGNLIDFYYANFSVFQSLPDHWAIQQLFPVMPIHRLDEEPTRQAILADITCDCDGKVDRFIDRQGVKNHLPVHERKPCEDYFIGAFLVGAYQETLGDLHNLLGDPHVVSVDLEEGELSYTHELEGDSVSDVLSYVEYDPKDLERRFRSQAERAVKKGLIEPQERRKLMDSFRSMLNGYTYYEG